MEIIKVDRNVFLEDLENCLTVIKRISSNLFECAYITPALTKRNVIISTF